MRRQTKAIVAISAFLLLTAMVGVNAAVGAAPSATIDAPSSISYASAHLSGTINPNGGPASITVYAEYKPVTASNWSYKNVQTIEGVEAEGSSPIPVETTITGLKPGTEYEVRFDAYSEGVETYSAEPNPTLTTLPVDAPTFSADPATSVTDNSAQLNATIDPGNADPAFDVSYQFEYSTDGTNWTPGPSGTVPAGTSPVAVSKPLTRLEPNTTYQVRLTVSNAGGTHTTSPPQPSFKTVAPAPTIATLPAATYPGGTAAALGGYVNPENSATTFWIEYGPTAAYGNSAPASEDASAGDKAKPAPVSQRIAGLTPRSTYHFRIVAENASGTTTGPDMSFETGPAILPVQSNCPNEAIRIEQHSTFLPDCRAWEKVTPADKGGVDVAGVAYEGKARAAASGGSLVFTSLGQFANVLGGGYPSYYLSQRGAEGWSVKPVLPRSSGMGSIIEWNGSAIGRTANLLQVDDQLHDFFVETTATLLPGSEEGVPASYLQKGLGGEYVPVTPIGPDYTQAVLGRFVLAKNVAPVFMTATADGRHALFISAFNYETGEVSNEEKLYEVDTKTGAMELVGVLPNGDPAIEAMPGSITNSMHHALSEDGSRLYFCTDFGRGGALYVRENGETFEISGEGRFYTATPDGSKAIYTKRSDGQAYLYDAASRTSTPLTSYPEIPQVGTVLAASENLEYVYLVADPGPLVPDYQDLPPDSYALYVWHDGTLKYAATLAGEQDSNNHSIVEDVHSYQPFIDAWISNPYASWTPDGKSLVFSTSAKVTGYDSGRFREVYRYDVESNKVSCLSCPNGPASGDAVLLYPNASESTEIGTHSRSLGPRSSISRDGKRVFFSTDDALVADDTNGAPDVYESENGQLNLISDGTRGSASRFVAADADGGEVFFATATPVSRADGDDLVDIYSARVDGGFPEPPQPVSPCQGEACQPGAAAAPAGAQVASNLVSGGGNEAVKRRACTKPRKQRKSHAKKKSAGKKAKHASVSAKKKQGKKRAGCKGRVGK